MTRVRRSFIVLEKKDMKMFCSKRAMIVGIQSQEGYKMREGKCMLVGGLSILKSFRLR